MDTTYITEQFSAKLLRPVGGKYVPVKWMFFDSETVTEVVDGVDTQRFKLGWTCYWDRWSGHWPGIKEWNYWESEEDVCKYFHEVCNRDRQLLLVGHNIFFDLQACGFFHYMTEWKWKLDFIYDKGMTYILRCKRSGATLTVLSTTNWFDQSLRGLGKVVGLEKGEVDFRTATKDELMVYCRRDVEILVKAMKYYIDFLRKNRLGKFSITKASQAFSSYRHRFMDHKILLHVKQEAKMLEREAYIGGRCECFRIGEQTGGPFVLLDVNSMYSFVMKTHEYPWEIVEWNQHLDIERYTDILKSHCVVAEVEVDTPEPVFAVRQGGKTIFPVGNFVCFLCSRGMQYALEHGYLKRIINSAVYRKANLFEGYIDYFHALRMKYKRQENEVMALLTKYMENSLYGKFAQKKMIKDEYDEYTGREYWREDVLNIDTGEMTIITNLMNKCIVQYSEGESDESFPAIAAHITEDARLILWDIMNYVGRVNVLYCDTDSVWMRDRDIEWGWRNISVTYLGALKIQQRTDRLYIGGAKNYRTDKSRHIKGIPGSAVEVEPGVFTFEVFRRQDSHLRAGRIAGAMTGSMTRTLRQVYDKGVVHADGSVTPFVLSLPGRLS